MRDNSESLAPGTVLLIADQPQQAALWQLLLEEKGCQVFCEQTIASAFDFLQGLVPSLILVDMELPHWQRLVLCESLRSVFSGPMLFMLEAASSQEAMDLYQAGADECLLASDQAVFLPVKAIAWMRRMHWVQPDRMPIQVEVVG